MHNILNTDTIAAQATPPGRGGVAIVRVSGPAASKIMLALLGRELTPRQATFLPFLANTNEILDEGIAVFFPNPHSFTGEDVLELHGHGGPIIVDMLLKRLLELGVRLARPGEFSERAFLNGKLDLAQAEAIADLIDAASQQAARCAMRSLQGEFSQLINALNEKIIHLRMYIEAAIDFTDEEINFLQNDAISSQLANILQQLADIEGKAKQGSLLREGITAVIAGEPNVGKSSLLNALSGKDSAIVTDVPGTTRDLLHEHILMDGMPIHVIDTAGLRASDDIVEQEGIRRAYREIAQADIVLHVMDAGSDKKIPASPIAADRPTVLIHNKIDLTHNIPAIAIHENNTVIALSAKSGIGIELLKDHIKMQIGLHNNNEGTFLARRRHLEALAQARTYVENAATQLSSNHRASELIAEDLRQTQQALGTITGAFTTEDLLGRIFASFCIGK
jgi:tRNA modification GTPase